MPKTTLFLTEINYSEESNVSTNNYYSVNKSKNSTHVTSSNDNKSISFSLPPTDLTSGNLDTEPNLTDRQQCFNKSLLALVFKEKSGLDINENVIESLMDNDVIEINNRSTPFPSSNPSYSHRNAAESRASTNTNTYNNQYIAHSTATNENISTSGLQRAKSCDFLSKRRNTLLSLLNESANESTGLSSKKDETSEYFFRNLKDLYRKLPKSGGKQLKLIDIPVTRTSNKMFDGIDRFDVAKTYKTTNLSQNLAEFIKKETEEIRSANKTILNAFISAKNNENDNESSAESSQNYQITESAAEKKKKFNFDPPLTSIEQKRYIDSYRQQFELEI